MAVNKVNYRDATLIDLTADTVTAEALLQGRTAHDKSGERIQGGMANRGAGGGVISSKTETVAISAGYYAGGGSVAIASAEQAKIIADNIKSGVTILGESGAVVPANYLDGTIMPGGDTTSVSITTDFLPRVAAIVASGDVTYSSSKTYIMAGVCVYNGNDGNMASFANKYSGYYTGVSRSTGNAVNTFSLDGYITDNGNGTYTTVLRHWNNVAYFKKGTKYGYIIAN